MIWVPNAKMSWSSTDTEGLLAEVKIVKGKSHWMLVDTETGVIMYCGKENHPLDAMHVVKGYVDALLDLRKAFKEKLNESVY